MEHPTLSTLSGQEPDLDYIVSVSRYAERWLNREPGFRARLALDLSRALSSSTHETWWQELTATDSETRLRQLRQRAMLRILSADLLGLATLTETVRAVSSLADYCVQQAVAQVVSPLIAQHGQPIGEDSGAEQTLLVVAMGKLGGQELNVSSDIDLVYCYPEEGHTTISGITNHDFFNKAARQITQLLSRETADGFVFRVDTRLRPWGDCGPLTCSLGALEQYLVANGREWERYAWLKARAITGSDAELRSVVNPFVYRKYLDFGAVASIRELHGQLRQEVMRRDRADNIKLGPGGIREIEFIAQIHQLIRGGRDPRLQVRGTMEALERLADDGLIAADEVRELREAYVYLRHLEHRLQYLDDQQTQLLPAGEDDQQRIARSLHRADYAAVQADLKQHRDHVTRHFENTFVAQEQEHGARWQGYWQLTDPDELADHLGTAGYLHPADTVHLVHQVRQSSRYRTLPDANRRRFDALGPALLECCATFSNPDETFHRLLHMLEAIARRESYLALLVEYPETLRRVASLYSASSWVSDFVTRHPILLDELLDHRLLEDDPDWTALAELLQRELSYHEGDTERLMDTLREFKNTQIFRLLAQDVGGAMPLERVSDHLSALADLMLQATMELCWRELTDRHTDTPHFAIIAYGKLGGKELGYASDLDIIFVYEDEHERAQTTYTRLARRMIAWLNTLTSSGTLYDVDLRLRPDGASGVLVTPLAAFDLYQREHAWVWEHQALTRARFVAGDARIGSAFTRIRDEMLTLPRDREQLRRDVLAMRQKMHDGHPNPSDLFDIKHDEGGIIDVEFLVQYLILAHAHQHPGLTGNLGNLALLRISAELGLIPARLAESVQVAYRTWRQRQHALKLQGVERCRIDPEPVEQLRDAVRTLWRLVLGDTGADAANTMPNS